ncbi:hypothetical protein E2320_001429, partial [Naja naja]
STGGELGAKKKKKKQKRKKEKTNSRRTKLDSASDSQEIKIQQPSKLDGSAKLSAKAICKIVSLSRSTHRSSAENFGRALER